MKKVNSTVFALALLSNAYGEIIIPGSNGTSGVLNVTEDTIIDLSLAADGLVDGQNTANGIYDASQWAVVFNYRSVNIDEGATLTFSNHPSKAPVVWLVSGDVTISGTVSLNGEDWQVAPDLADGGPGGFRGGSATFSTGPRASAGFGPGGGFQESNSGHGGAYSSSNGNAASYGNPSLIPLIGGSGGSGDPEFTGDRFGAGGGGGAILIACAGSVTLDGTVQANGGAGVNSLRGTDANTGGGSGGGIRIVCDSFGGTGVVNTLGGDGWQSGGLGRIRIERVENTGEVALTPDPSVIPLTDGDSALVWPPSTAPQVRVLSIGGEVAPTDPRAGFGAEGPDVSLPETSTTQVVIETTNAEEASTVEVRVTPRSNANATIVNATMNSITSTDPLVIQWVADLPVNVGFSAVQVRVVRP